ncbi:MAG: metallophosphoesterase family protein [Chloroflexia bacterium]|nr:metallophosphoesterase family protein [Chloroflexia bacterium]
MTIGVLSDTHVNDRGSRRLPPQIPAMFDRLGVGLILHAGDLNSLSVLTILEEVAPTLAVHGNSDLPETRRLLPARIDLAVGRFRLALIHGDAGRTADRTAEELIGRVDGVVYGHSHVPRIEEIGGTLLFNPGSPTDKRWWPDYSVGLLRVNDEGIVPELIVFRAAADLDRIVE